MTALNATHDPARRSRVHSANVVDCDFPIQNLPLGMFDLSGTDAPGPGMAIGDQIVDLRRLQAFGQLSGLAEDAAKAACQGNGLNSLMAMGNEAASALRAQVSDLLNAAGPTNFDIQKVLVPMVGAHMHLPAQVGNFSDFAASAHHFSRMVPGGLLSRNYMHLPIAYHGRASSIRLSGDVIRPHAIDDVDGAVRFAPSTQMDYELELGFWVGRGNALGTPIQIGEARDHIFGYSLVNDWSVRDAQMFESFPLGPFLGKSIITTLSPWIVTAEALQPFVFAATARTAGQRASLPHLSDTQDQAAGGLDIQLSALIRSAGMRAAGLEPEPLTVTNTKHLYWTTAQMLTHHASNGCNMMPGDLIGTGTVSGPTDDSRACLAEINQKGAVTFDLPNGERRTWLEDGDEIILTGRARRDGFVGIGFGSASGTIVSGLGNAAHN